MILKAHSILGNQMCSWVVVGFCCHIFEMPLPFFSFLIVIKLYLFSYIPFAPLRVEHIPCCFIIIYGTIQVMPEFRNPYSVKMQNFPIRGIKMELAFKRIPCSVYKHNLEVA